VSLVNIKTGTPPELVRCWSCNQLKPPSNFYKDKSKHWAISGDCKCCRKAGSQEWRKRNSERDKEAKRQWWKKNKIKKRLITWRQSGIKITLDEFNLLKSNQGGKCAICFRPDEGYKKSLAVDHDHKTGKVRGLLCGSCNVGIGQFKDSVDLLNSAIGYLNDRTNNIS
jgi:hypothetical protein